MSADVWDRSRLDDVVAITDAAFPGENLTADDLAGCLFDDPDPTVVLAGDDSVAGLVVRQVAEEPVAFLQLLAVVPSAQRLGRGRALLGEAERWGAEHGARHLSVGAAAPFYLWGGVDVRWTAANCLFEATGYRPAEAVLNLSFPSSHRAEPPEGVEIRRVLADEEAAAAVEFCGRHWPNWVAELERGIDHGACLLAWSGGDVVAFGCHSVNRVGWLGPMGSDPDRRHKGVGNALLGAIATDVRAAGFPDVEVSWIGPFGFYANAAGASVSRVFRRWVKRLA